MPTPSSRSYWAEFYPIIRLFTAFALLTCGGATMYVAIIGLKPVAAEFDATRAQGSLTYTFLMIGYGAGGILLGYLSDRLGVMLPALFGCGCLAIGFALAAGAQSLPVFYFVHSVLLGLLGSSALFAPLVADISHWFTARRGIAVAIVISGSYAGGAVWPPAAQYLFDTIGWRATYEAFAWFAILVMAPLTFILVPSRRNMELATGGEPETVASKPLGFSPASLQCLLCFAGLSCCVAMAVPQVHLVAHATDLGHSAVDGARMLALMLACGVVSRLLSGWLSDRIGGLKTLLLGSVLQGLMLVAFIPFEGLGALYILAALFGLSQGGIVPSYAIIIRSFFASTEAGWRIGAAIFFTMLGMALGGWIAGELFDRTGSYTAGFLIGVTFNVWHAAIALWLLRRAHTLAQPE
ncbi:MAG: MFS transporter [Gammaproteobacteria bacterium]|nr:MFS transporter [Gammaproteobacteria bacterium]